MKKVKIVGAAILSLMVLAACEGGDRNNKSPLVSNEKKEVDIYEKSTIKNVLAEMERELEKFEEEDESYYVDIQYVALGEVYYAEIYEKIKLYFEILEGNKNSENLKMLKKIEMLNENIMAGHKNYDLLVGNKENELVESIIKMKDTHDAISKESKEGYDAEIAKHLQSDLQVKDDLYTVEYLNLLAQEDMAFIRGYFKQLVYSGSVISSDAEADLNKFEEALDKIIFDNDKKENENYYNKIAIESLKLIDVDEIKKIAENRTIEDKKVQKELQLVYEILGMDLRGVVNSDVASEEFNVNLLKEILKQNIYKDNYFLVESEYIDGAFE